MTSFQPSNFQCPYSYITMCIGRIVVSRIAIPLFEIHDDIIYTKGLSVFVHSLCTTVYIYFQATIHSSFDKI